MTPPVDPAQEVDDVEDLDDEFDVDQPVPIACQWGMPAWCATGRHHRCYFTTDAETIKSGTYGLHNGHLWVCPCPVTRIRGIALARTPIIRRWPDRHRAAPSSISRCSSTCSEKYVPDSHRAASRHRSRVAEWTAGW